MTNRLGTLGLCSCWLCIGAYSIITRNSSARALNARLGLFLHLHARLAQLWLFLPALLSEMNSSSFHTLHRSRLLALKPLLFYSKPIPSWGLLLSLTAAVLSSQSPFLCYSFNLVVVVSSLPWPVFLFLSILTNSTAFKQASKSWSIPN